MEFHAAVRYSVPRFGGSILMAAGIALILWAGALAASRLMQNELNSISTPPAQSGSQQRIDS